MNKLLEVNHLVQEFPVGKKNIFGQSQKMFRSVDDVSFTLGEKETLGILGESGSGKSTLAR